MQLIVLLIIKGSVICVDSSDLVLLVLDDSAHSLDIVLELIDFLRATTRLVQFHKLLLLPLGVEQVGVLARELVILLVRIYAIGLFPVLFARIARVRSLLGRVNVVIIN